MPRKTTKPETKNFFAPTTVHRKHAATVGKSNLKDLNTGVYDGVVEAGAAGENRLSHRKKMLVLHGDHRWLLHLHTQ